MDKSDQYIAMCSQAKKLQKAWVPRHGDFFLGENNRIEVWIEGKHNKRCLAQGVRLHFEQGLPKTRQYIWLPRLDQLMELAQEPGKRFEQITQRFWDWTTKAYLINQPNPQRYFSSLEQTWLAFVMLFKFGQKWQDSDWSIV